MVEVEQKFVAVDFAALEGRLAEWGVRESERRLEADHYFNAPDRDFARTDEALRIRRVECEKGVRPPKITGSDPFFAHGPASFVTYKGPKRDTLTKTRTEIEVPLGGAEEAADDFARLLVHLGYRSVAVVRKERRRFRLQREGFPLEVTLDEVEGLGRFAELEISVEEDRLEAARTVLLRTAAELGLTASERRSYLELLLEKANQGVQGT